MMSKKKRWLIPLVLLLAAGARAEEPVDQLRQRLADRLAEKDAVPASKPVVVKSAAKPGKPAKATAPPHWGYTGDIAPDRWAELAPEFRQCGVGTRQSPIDIRDSIAVDLEKIAFDYRPGAFSVLDDGHTVQVQVAPGSTLSVMGRRYELQRLHFHRPSEERVNGRQFDMVAHLEHRDAEGRIAMLAVLLERGRDDQPQPLLQTVWGNLPLEKGEALAAQVQLDPALLLPTDRSYYTYMGSMTTPPCTEGVLWLVLRQPVAVTAQQLDVFARLYPMNARPLQAGSGRLIKESLGGR
jgi:carbonic anhydrase